MRVEYDPAQSVIRLASSGADQLPNQSRLGHQGDLLRALLCDI
jgi:hypothetical protein